MIPIRLKGGKTDKNDQRPVLDLNLPEQSRAPRETVLNDAKKCSRWLERLPRANLGEVSRRIFNAIIDFNRIEMPPKTRLRIAELFLPEVGYIVANLEKYYIDSALPLSRKNRKIAILCRELYLELTLSYKIIVSQLVNRQRQFDNNLLIVSLHRAVCYLGMVHRQSAQHYEASPEGSWQELHKLYAYAWQNNVCGIPVRMENGAESTESTLEDLYTQVCALSVCAPHQLTNAQLQAVIRLLPEWSEHITLDHEVPPPTATGTTIRYAVDLLSDAPPAAIEAFDALVPRHHLVFECGGFVQHLRKRFAAIQPGQRKSNRFQLQLYRQIIGILRNSERNFVRTKLHFELNLVKGLNTLYRMLTASDENSVESDYSSVMTTRHPPLSGLTDLDSRNPLGEELFPESFSTQQPDSEPSTSGYGSDHKAGDSPLFACQSANESASGYCLVWPADKAPRIKVGELLGIQSPTKKQSYSVAVVRWLTNHPGESLHVGIEIIAPVCTAARLSPRSINASGGAVSGLLLPEITSASQDSSVLLPPNFEIESRILEVHAGDDRFTLKLTQFMESTPAFNRYGYQRIDRDDKEPGSLDEGQATGDSDDGNDAGVWALL